MSKISVEELKRQWVKDPIWDIEDTEGFEEHRAELLKFRQETEERWRHELERRRHDEHIHHESRVVAWTNLTVNRLRINVTAREGATTEDILQTCRALLEAVQTIENAYRQLAEAKAETEVKVEAENRAEVEED